ARPVRLLPEDQLLERAAALAAVLLRPADAEPAVAAHAADDLPGHRPAHVFPLFHERAAQLGREEVAVVGAQLLAERVLLGGEIEMHRGAGRLRAKLKRVPLLPTPWGRATRILDLLEAARPIVAGHDVS